MNWYIGQEVVCVKTHSQKAVKEGKIYTIQGIKAGSCKCSKVEIDVGIRHGLKGDLIFCDMCNTHRNNDGIWWIAESLFAPLSDISELESILNEEKVKA